MKRELKEKWIAALRSGEYEQAVGALRIESSRSNAYCCLGVLSTVAKPLGWNEEAGLYHVNNDDVTEDKLDEAEELPSYALKAVGLSQDEQLALIAMNDNKRLSFREIADWIEENIDAE